MSWLSKLFGSKPAAPTLWTGKVLCRDEARLGFGHYDHGVDDTYAEVSFAALAGYYDWFKAEMFKLGVTRWDETFDCDNHAAMYADLMCLRFFKAGWESNRPPAQTAAVACYYYQSPRGPHAINAVLTDQGIIFVEPQSGQILNLTLAERASAFRCIY